MIYAKLIWKNVLRNKLRTILTLCVITLALGVLSTVIAVAAQFDRSLDETNALRLFTRHKVSLANPLPERYGPQIEKVPGVVAMTTLNWFGGLYIDQAHTDFVQFS